MKNIKIYLFALLAPVFIIQSCDGEKDLLAELEKSKPLPKPITGKSGGFDFKKYVAIGNSLTAGLMDFALYTDGQKHAFPNLLAKQFQTTGIGGGTFNQPDINSANGFSPGGTGGKLTGRWELSLSQERPVPTAGETIKAYTGDKSALNNLGVPHLRVTQVNHPAVGIGNPYYKRFAGKPGIGSVLSQALAAKPTFFTYWLGANDVLEYAVHGGTQKSITSQPDFQKALTQSLGALTHSGTKGVVLTLPPVIISPFFRAIPYNRINLTNQAIVDGLNAGFEGFNKILAALAKFKLITPTDAQARKVGYTLGANPILMYDGTLKDLGPLMDRLVAMNILTKAQRAALEPFRQARPATKNDLFPLTLATSLGQPVGGNPLVVMGVSYPVPDNLVLSASEVKKVVGARATFNATIAGVVAGINKAAGANVITLVDVQPTFIDLFGLDAKTASFLVDPTGGRNPFLKAMAEKAAAAADGALGIKVEGQNLRPDFSPNGIFSTDGIHPNPRGHAIIANLIIDELNKSEGTSIPRVNVLALRSVITTK